MTKLGLNTSGISSIDYSGSSLRYGLIDVRPIEIRETIKRFGIKFLRITRKFESLRPPETYDDIVAFQNQMVLDSIEIPHWFDADKLIKEFSQHAIENYEKDKEFKNAVERVKAERTGTPLLSFVQFAKNRFESEMDYYLEIEADRFLRSNFALSFYNRLALFDNTYLGFLRVLEDRVRKYEFLAHYARNFDMQTKRYAEMRAAVGPIIDQIDTNLFCYARVKKYVTVWNAKNYDELQNPKFLDIRNVDYSEFEKIFNEYNKRLTETRQFLLSLDREILSKEIDSSEYPAKAAFSKLLALP
jgi:hypothetical protein